MGRVARWICYILAPLALLIGLAWWLYANQLPSSVRVRVLDTLADMGFDQASIEHVAVARDHALLSGVQLDDDKRLSLGELAIDYELGSAISGQVESLRITGGQWRIIMRDGSVDLGPITRFTPLPTDPDAPPGLPFDTVELVNCIISLQRDDHTFAFTLNGTLTAADDESVEYDLSINALGNDVPLRGVVDWAGDGVAVNATSQMTLLGMQATLVSTADLQSRHATAKLTWGGDNTHALTLEANGAWGDTPQFDAAADGRLLLHAASRKQLERAGVSTSASQIAIHATLAWRGDAQGALPMRMQIDHDGAITLDNGMTVDLRRLVFEGEARLGDDRGFAGQLLFSDLALAHAGADMQIEGVQGRIPMRWPGVESTPPNMTADPSDEAPENNADKANNAAGNATAATPPPPSPPAGRLVAEAVRIANVDLGSLTGAAEVDGLSLNFATHLNRDANAYASLHGTLQLDPAGPQGRVHVSVPQIDLGSPWVARFLPADSGLTLEGDAAVAGSIALGPAADDQPGTDLAITFEQVGLRSQDTAVAIRGASGELHLTSLAPLQTPAEQQIRIDRIMLGGLELLNTRIALRIQSADDIYFERIVSNWDQGGRVRAHAFRFNPSAEQPAIHTELFFEDLSLDALLSLIPGDKASGSGRLYGRLPIHIRPQATNVLAFEPGFLTTAPGAGEGVIRVQDRELLNRLLGDARTGDNRQEIVGALQNFKYSTLWFEITRNPDGSLTCTIRTSGIGIAGEKVPLNLTVNINGIEDALNSALIVKRGTDRALDYALDRFFE